MLAHSSVRFLVCSGAQGIEYDVIYAEVEDLCPDIVDLFQEAGNIKNHMLKGSSRLEVLLKMHRVAARLLQELPEDAAPDKLDELWERVKAEAARGGAPFRLELDDLSDVVKMFSGTRSDPFLLHEFRDFVRTLKIEREVRGELWGAIARLEIGAPFAAPKFRLACLFAAAGASDAYAVGREQRLLSESDLLILINLESVVLGHFRLHASHIDDVASEHLHELAAIAVFDLTKKGFLLVLVEMLVVKGLYAS